MKTSPRCITSAPPCDAARPDTTSELGKGLKVKTGMSAGLTLAVLQAYGKVGQKEKPKREPQVLVYVSFTNRFFWVPGIFDP